jgi:ABC-2 type transport system permease protein
MNAFSTHFSFEFKTGLRNATQTMMNYLFPLGFYALMGLVMTQINPLFKESMIPAMIIFTIMASCLLGLPNPLVESENGAFSAATRSTACLPHRSSLSPP